MRRTIFLALFLAILSWFSLPLNADEPLPEHAVARLGTTRFRQVGRMTSVAFIAGDKSLLTTGLDEVINCWDVATGKLRWTRATDLSGRPVQMPVAPGVFPLPGRIQVKVSADGKRALAFESEEYKFRLWELPTGKVIREQLPNSNQPRVAMALSPDGTKIAWLNFYEKIHIFDTVTEETTTAPMLMKTEYWGGIESLSYSPDGRTICRFNSKSPEIDFVDATDGAVRATAKSRNALPCTACAFTWDSKSLIFVTEKAIYRVRVSDGMEQRLVTDAASVVALAIVPGDRHAVLAFDDKPPRLVDLASGKLLREFGQLWRSSGSKPTLAISPDGTLLAVAGVDSAAHIYELSTGKRFHGDEGFCNSVESVDFSSNGKTILTADFDARVQIWDAVGFRRRLDYQSQGQDRRNSAISPDHRRFAFAEDHRIEFHALDGSRAPGPIPLSKDAKIDAIAFSRDGRFLRTLKLDAKPAISVYDVLFGKQVRTIEFDDTLGIDGRTGWELSAQSRFMLLRGNRDVESDFRLGLLDLETGKISCRLPLPDDARLWSSGFSTDGRMLALEFDNGRVVVFETATGEQRFDFCRPPGKRDEPLDPFLWRQMMCRFSAIVKLLAYGNSDNSIEICCLATGKRLAVLKGHRGPVTCLAFSPDGKRLASGSADTTVLIWDITKIVGDAAKPAPVSADQFAAEWRQLLAGDAKRAFLAVERLGHPDALPFFEKELLKPAPKLDAAKIDQWLRDLDSTRFADREQATAELAKLGDAAAPNLKKALEQKPSAEAARRLRELLDKTGLYNLTGEKLRQWRALEAIERIRTPAARELLRKLAAGPEGLLAEEARIALKRLE